MKFRDNSWRGLSADKWAAAIIALNSGDHARSVAFAIVASDEFRTPPEGYEIVKSLDEANFEIFGKKPIVEDDNLILLVAASGRHGDRKFQKFQILKDRFLETGTLVVPAEQAKDDTGMGFAPMMEFLKEPKDQNGD